MNTSHSKWVVAALAVLLLTSGSAEACSVCFNGEGSKEAVTALNSAILLMLGVLACVLGALAAFFVHLARRASQPIPEHVQLAEAVSKEA